MFPDEQTEIGREDNFVVMPDGSPNFYEWSDRDLQVYIAANLFALRTDVALIKQLAGEVAGQAGPIIEKVQSSPLLKMLGVR